MLDKKTKQKIRSVLTSHMTESGTMHMATAALLLKENGIDYKENGYEKVRFMLEDLDFLEVRNVSIDGKRHMEIALKETNRCSSEKNLSTEQKKQLYGIFCGIMEKGKPLHMASVNQALVEKGVDRARFGFSKAKTFFGHLDSFLTVQNGMSNGVPVVMVTLRDVPEWNGVTDTSLVISSKEKPAEEAAPKAPSAEKGKPKRPAPEPKAEKTEPKPQKPQKPKKEEKTEEKRVEEKKAEFELPQSPLSYYSDMPARTLSYLRSFCDLGALPDLYIRNRIDEGYEKALREKTLQIKGDRILFATPMRDRDGAVIYASVRPSSIENGLPWFLNYLGSGDFEAQSVRPGKMLEKFADLGEWPLFLERLADIAFPEDWTFGGSENSVLKQYIQYTFYRLQLEDKILISEDDTFAAFNTGLVDKHYDDLYACFVPNEEQEGPDWRFSGFCTAASRGAGKRLVETFNPLPEPPSYFERKEDLLFDLEKDLHVDFYHIVVDNIHRLPIGLLQEECAGSPEAMRLIRRLPSARSYERRMLYDKLRDLVDENQHLFNRIRYRVEDAIDLAKKQVRWNYRVAVPCFFTTRSNMSLMLPLDLDYDGAADTALVVELMRSGNYQGQTVLTMRQAYIDARLICRPAGGDWLQVNPQSAADDEED